MVPSVYFSFFCLLVSSVSNFSPHTRGAVVVTFFRLTCSVVLWGGRNTVNKYPWHVWGVLKARIAPFRLRLPLPACLQWGMGWSTAS